MSDLFENHTVGFPTRLLMFMVGLVLIVPVPSHSFLLFCLLAYADHPRNSGTLLLSYVRC